MALYLRRQAAAGGGGGGAGRGNNLGNSGGAAGGRVRGPTASIGNDVTIENASPGGGSNLTVTGSGGWRGREVDAGDADAQAGSGGDGGFWGAAGSSGQDSIYKFPLGNGHTSNGGTGGAGGLAVVGNSNITWGATGTRYGGISA